MSNRIYLDSNILIYYIEGSLSRKLEVRRILTDDARRGGELFTSEITSGEYLLGVYKKAAIHEGAYLSLFRDGEFISMAPIDTQIVRRAALLGAQFNMKLVDAIHVATADACGCSVFLTNDRGIRAPAGIEVRYLSAEA